MSIALKNTWADVVKFAQQRAAVLTGAGAAMVALGGLAVLELSASESRQNKGFAVLDRIELFPLAAAVDETAPYHQLLETGYRRLAEHALDDARFAMASDFRRQADAAAKGQAPDLFKTAAIEHAGQRSEADGWRALVMRRLERGLSREEPAAAARAHIAYNCIVRASAEDGSKSFRQICIQELRVALAAAQPRVAGDSAQRALDFSAPEPKNIALLETAAIAKTTPRTASTAAAQSVDSAELSGRDMAIEQRRKQLTAPNLGPALQPERRAVAYKGERSRSKQSRRSRLVAKAFFYPGSTKIDFSARMQLNGAMSAAIKHARRGRRVVLRIVGHADSDGSAEDNRSISKRRAISARDALKRRLKLLARRDPKLRRRIRISVTYLGDAAPNLRGNNDRRVEIFLTVKKGRHRGSAI